MREKLLDDLYKSLDDIRYVKQRYVARIEELDAEEDMTLLAIKDLEGRTQTEEDAECN